MIITLKFAKLLGTRNLKERTTQIMSKKKYIIVLLITVCEGKCWLKVLKHPVYSNVDIIISSDSSYHLGSS